MNWSIFPYFAAVSVLLWAAGCFLPRRKAVILMGAGLLVYAAFIVLYWAGLGRPPLRTTGETRLWYSFFMMLSGLLTYLRWDYRWVPAFSLVVATVFICLNVFKPEIHDETLMPALQSWWFVPHVAVYIFSYSVLGCAFLFGCAELAGRRSFLDAADTLVYIGLAFLSLGMLSGSLWAKQAWGDFWTWDLKETWAAITWCIYLIYIHIRLSFKPGRKRDVCCSLLLILGFAGLQMCWWGVNLLPAASSSLHAY